MTYEILKLIAIIMHPRKLCERRWEIMTKATIVPLHTCKANCGGGMPCGKEATTTANGKAAK